MLFLDFGWIGMKEWRGRLEESSRCREFEVEECGDT